MTVAPNLMDDALEFMIAPGDVLVVKGDNRLTQIGAAGGFLGHVLIAAAYPRRVPRASPLGERLHEMWPRDDIGDLWLVKTLESTRGTSGLAQFDVLVYVEPETSELTLAGEIYDKDKCSTTKETLELWQSPAALRGKLRTDLMASVIADMKKNEADWSAVTAVRALIRSASVDRSVDKDGAMHEIRQCWKQQPICTSVVIAFWQRYLCYFARELEELNGSRVRPLDLILQWMPLKADRALPGELMAALQAAGWVPVMRVPQMFRPGGPREIPEAAGANHRQPSATGARVAEMPRQDCPQFLPGAFPQQLQRRPSVGDLDAPRGRPPRAATPGPPEPDVAPSSPPPSQTVLLQRTPSTDGTEAMRMAPPCMPETPSKVVHRPHIAALQRKWSVPALGEGPCREDADGGAGSASPAVRLVRRSTLPSGVLPGASSPVAGHMLWKECSVPAETPREEGERRGRAASQARSPSPAATPAPPPPQPVLTRLPSSGQLSHRQNLPPAIPAMPQSAAGLATAQSPKEPMRSAQPTRFGAGIPVWASMSPQADKDTGAPAPVAATWKPQPAADASPQHAVRAASQGGSFSGSPLARPPARALADPSPRDRGSLGSGRRSLRGTGDLKVARGENGKVHLGALSASGPRLQRVGSSFDWQSVRCAA